MQKSLLLGLGAVVLVSGIAFALFSGGGHAQSFDDTSAFSCASLGSGWETVSSQHLPVTFCRDIAWGPYTVNTSETMGVSYIAFSGNDIRLAFYHQPSEANTDVALSRLRAIDFSQDDIVLAGLFGSDEQELVQKNVFNGIKVLQGVVRSAGDADFHVDFYAPSLPVGEGEQHFFLTSGTAHEVGLINILTSLRPRE